MTTVTVIAGIVGLAAMWHPVRHYLNSTETDTEMPQSKDKKKNKARRIQEAMIFKPDVFGASEWSQPFEDYVKVKPRYNEGTATGNSFNSNALDALRWRNPILEKVMEALADPNTHLIGVYGLHDEIKDTLLQRVYRRVHRDKLFDTILTATVTKKPDVNKIQEEIARQLGFSYNQKSKDKRANELIHRIKNVQKILIVLCDLCRGLDLRKAGIPYGADHTGCKILLTSTTEEVLSNQMHTQKNFMV